MMRTARAASRGGSRYEAEAEAALVCAPVTADTRRQSAAEDDSESGAERPVAMVCDTTRHVGLGLQNRRLQVRFLSHLPLLVPEMKPLQSISHRGGICLILTI
jgi:hypothetical protein